MKKSRISRQDDPLLSSEAKPLIRVFISSTFRDMMDEREYLLKQVFPRLHRICAERGVEMSEIDLRWGVTEKEARRGKVVEICLREIDKSRPYFIGLLGERYGWAPEKKELPGLGPLWEDFPWVEKDLAEGRSITEMEIQYGVLRSPAMKGQAFFYLRHPSLTPEGRGFREEEGSASASRLKALKKTVLRQKSHPVAEYRSLEALGTSVYEHFRRLLDRDFPARPPLSPLERARRDHAAFALSRTGVYVPVPTLFEKLDGFAEAGGKPLVLVGPPGEGKSALLSNWLVRFRRRRPETFLLYHFAAAGGVADSRDLLVRLCSEMKERFGLEDEIPEAPGKLVDAFPLFLAKTPEPWVLLIDGLDEIGDGSAANLAWLPETFPSQVRVVLSASEGRASELLAGRGWKILRLPGLSVAGRTALVETFLARHSKRLAPRVSSGIARRVKNPLILVSLLEELRLFGLHERLEERLGEFLAAENGEAFFDRVLERMERDYETEEPGLVRRVFRLLLAAKRGLAEREILEITGIPPLRWSPFFSALESHLVSRAGLLGFSHAFLRKAAEKRYLVKPSEAAAAHRALADYFGREPRSGRSLDELPFHLLRAGLLKRLHDFLTDLPAFVALRRRDRLAAVGYWRSLEGRFDPAASYRKALAAYKASGKASEAELDEARYLAGIFLNEIGKYAAAEELLAGSLEVRKKLYGAASLEAASLENELALLRFHLGDDEGAVRLSKAVIAAAKAGGKALDGAAALAWNNFGLAASRQGRSEEALAAFEASLGLYGRLYGKKHPLTVKGWNNVGCVLLEQGRYADALPFLERARRLKIELFGEDHPDTAETLTNYGSALSALSRFEEALGCFDRALGPFAGVYGRRHPRTAEILNNRGICLVRLGRLAEAETDLREALEIRTEAYGPDHPAAANSYNNLYVFAAASGDYPGAVAWLERALAAFLAAHGENHPSVAAVYGNLAEVYLVLNEDEKAEAFIGKSLAIRERTLGRNHPLFAETASQAALGFLKAGRWEEAISLYLKAEKAFRLRLDPKDPRFLDVYKGLGIANSELGKTKAALRAFLKAEPLAAEGSEDLALVRYRIGKLLFASADYERAKARLLGALGFFASSGDAADGTLADLLFLLGRTSGLLGDAEGEKAMYGFCDQVSPGYREERLRGEKTMKKKKGRRT